MNYQKCYIVRVDGQEIARYKGNPGSAFQIATNHAFGILNECNERMINGESEYANISITVNGRNIKDYILN
jgi:hypothetical protein